MNRKYDVILFDMDGTIADTDPMIIDTMNTLYDKYKGGKRRPPEEIVYFSGPPIRDTLKQEFPDLDQKFIYDEFHRESRIRYDTHIFNFPHTKEVLLKLKEDGFKLGVVTNKQHDLTLVALNVLGLNDIFDVIIGFNDVSKGKPDPEGIYKAVAMLNGDIKHTLYVGDNKSDWLTANNAHVDCCIVNWGPRVLPKEVTPTFKINDYLELGGYLYE